jgi:hypothetical protein
MDKTLQLLSLYRLLGELVNSPGWRGLNMKRALARQGVQVKLEVEDSQQIINTKHIFN